MTKPWMQFGTVDYTIGSAVLDGARVEEIARAASHINRFNGHSLIPYSIADHMVYVSHLTPDCVGKAMFGLVHDIAETVTGDITWPMKQAMPPEVRKWFEHVTMAAENALFEILDVNIDWPQNIRDAVKEADWAAVSAERQQYLPDCTRKWDMLKKARPVLSPRRSVTAGEAAERWLARYDELIGPFNDWATAQGFKL